MNKRILKTSFIIVFFIGFIYPSSIAQKFDWIRILKQDNYSNILTKHIINVQSDDSFLYVHFNAPYASRLFEDTSLYLDGGLTYLAKYSKDGNYIWAKCIDSDAEFDVSNGKIYITGSIRDDFKLNDSIYTNISNRRRSVLFCLNEDGSTHWIKFSSAYYNACYPTAISVMKDKILVGMENQSRRSIPLIGLDSLHNTEYFNRNILQLFDTAGNFKKLEVFNDKNNPINGITNNNSDFYISLGLLDGFNAIVGENIDNFYSRIFKFSGEHNQLETNKKFASHKYFTFDKIVALNSGKILAKGMSYSKLLQINEKYVIGQDSSAHYLTFLALLDENHAPIWKKSFDSKYEELTDFSYDEKNQVVYYGKYTKMDSMEIEEYKDKHPGQPYWKYKYDIVKAGIDGNTISKFTTYCSGRTGSFPFNPLVLYDEDDLYLFSTLDYSFDSIDYSASVRSNQFILAKINLEHVLTEQEDFGQDINIWPNPARNYLVIDKNDLVLETPLLYDIGGKLTNKYKIIEKERVMVLYFDNMQAGMYILQLKINGKWKSKKFIVI